MSPSFWHMCRRFGTNKNLIRFLSRDKFVSEKLILRNIFSRTEFYQLHLVIMDTPVGLTYPSPKLIALSGTNRHGLFIQIQKNISQIVIRHSFHIWFTETKKDIHNIGTALVDFNSIFSQEYFALCVKNVKCAISAILSNME